MHTTLKLAATVLVPALVLVTGSIARSDDGSPGRVLLTPDAIKWAPIPTLPGAQTAVMLGHPAKPGPYTMRVKFAPNTVNPPHVHPDDRQAVVISGTWYFGHGDTIQRDQSSKLPPGTFFTESANTVHYNFTTSEEVVVQISGMGPTATTYKK